MLAVLLHELVHYRLHFSNGEIQPGINPRQAELEAEFGAYLAGGLLGVDTLKTTKDYFVFNEIKPEELYHALTRAGEVALWIVKLITGEQNQQYTCFI